MTLLSTLCLIFHLDFSEFVWLQISSIDLFWEAENIAITQYICQGKKLTLSKCGPVIMSLFLTSFLHTTFNAIKNTSSIAAANFWKGTEEVELQLLQVQPCLIKDYFDWMPLGNYFWHHKSHCGLLMASRDRKFVLAWPILLNLLLGLHCSRDLNLLKQRECGLQSPATGYGDIQCFLIYFSLIPISCHEIQISSQHLGVRKLPVYCLYGTDQNGNSVE